MERTSIGASISGRAGCTPSHHLSLPVDHHRQRRHGVLARGITIDRRQHFELAWRKQTADDPFQAVDTGCCPINCITEVRDLQHLERVVDAAGSSVLVLALYSRSCGACKDMLHFQQRLCKEANQQSAGAVFLRHNIRNEFDDLTDIARLHRVRSVPTFVFFVGGAQVNRINMVDSRADASAIRTIIGRGRQNVSAALRQHLWRYAPSACK